MKIFEYEQYIRGFFRDREIPISKTAMNAFRSPRFLSEEVLLKMRDRDLKVNVGELLSEVLGIYERRAERATRRIILRDIDVEPVLRRRFCRLPPFCRRY